MRAVLLIVGRSRWRGEVVPEGVAVQSVRPGDVRPAARSLVADGARRFCVVGSDADGADVIAAGLDEGTRLALALAPRSRSDLLDMFAITTGDGLTRLLDGTPYPMDVGVAEAGGRQRLFLNSVTAGGAAGPPAIFPWWPPIGRPGAVTVTGRRERSAPDGVAVFVMNGQCWGGMTVAPRANLVDGAVDVQVMGGGRPATARARPAMRQGLHVMSREVTRVSVGRATISIPPRWRVHTDRRPWGRGSFDVSVLPDAVDLLI